MIELSMEKIRQMLHEETPGKEEAETILRGVYTRYMRLYERYFADIGALNGETVAGLRQYHEETESLIRYYYMDIPQDICTGLKAFGDRYTARLLGNGWHEYLSDCLEAFREKSGDEHADAESLQAAFQKQSLAEFYDAMDYIFREGFGTGSRTAGQVVSGIAELLFGKEK